jgi:hypothetical protein
MHYLILRRIKITCLLLLTIFSMAHSQNKKPLAEYYQIKLYNYTTAEQETILDNYLRTAYLPALHKKGFKQVGVFKAIANDTSVNKKLFIFFSSPSLDKLVDLPALLQKDSVYTKAAADYLTPAYDHPPFARMESILLKAFRLATTMTVPSFTNNKSERVYELRSYESPTENLYVNKVKMFNEGGEISLFRRLQFNAVFYADVISGSHMPNLMYMTTFENMDERTKHWDAFKNDPEWKRLSGLPEYQHNVSKADIMLLHPTEYSDF